jgi:hypothetical protein
MKKVLGLIILLIFSSLQSASSNQSDFRSNDYFLKVNEYPFPLPTQHNEGTLSVIHGKILVIRRLGETVMLDAQLNPISSWNQVLKIDVKPFNQRRVGERGLEGVKGSIFQPHTNKLYVSLVEVVNECASLKVLSFNFRTKEGVFDQKKVIWSLPSCVPVAELEKDFPEITHHNLQNQPNISQAGGRLALLKNGNLLFSVGNFGDAWMKDSKLLASIRSKNSFFGKILELQLQSKSNKIFSTGHRNVQGLVISSDGRVFASEHGREGGDEVNLIREGLFYGWPFKSLGHDYSDEFGYFSASGRPDEVLNTKFESPVLSWVPSIAPSQILEVRTSLAPKWEGDLLMGTLRDQSLRRLRIERDRIILDERIPLNFRIRDLVQVGKYLYLLDDVGQVKRIQFVTRQK